MNAVASITLYLTGSHECSGHYNSLVSEEEEQGVVKDVQLFVGRREVCNAFIQRLHHRTVSLTRRFFDMSTRCLVLVRWHLNGRMYCLESEVQQG